jgi:hypothetical protein
MRDALAKYVRECFIGSRDARRLHNIEESMLDALRAVRGEYDQNTLNDINQFGGSKVYARITASKVRGTSALLREIYTASDRPWALNPTPDPDLPGPDINSVVTTQLNAEVAEAAAAGTPPTPDQITQRQIDLRELVLEHRKKQAKAALRTRENSLDDMLWEGGFYTALWEFLGDIAAFPYAVIKGPVIRNKPVLAWENGKPSVVRKPVPHWVRCSPFDVYFAPWAQSFQDGYIIHRERVTRRTVQSLIGLQSYNKDAINRVLASWDTLNTEWYDYIETDRALLEQRESQTNPTYSSRASDRPQPMLSFYGSVSVDTLLDWGMKRDALPADSEDVNVFAYLIGNEVIGVTLNPHPQGLTPFYGDSFERVPGSVYGNAIPGLINDVQSVGNAALRALVNNLSMASGPMGWINEDRIAPNEANPGKIWPWKIFRFTDPQTSSNSEKPMEFFQPDANVEKLFAVYEQMLNMADEITTLPRYMQGNSQGIGTAGRTAAGLSMLMEAANRTIKQTVTSIDTNVVEQVIEHLNVYLALTRPDIVMAGDISVQARGAAELMQRETMRMRRLEFLNITNNPVDQQLTGLDGRYNILKEIARDLQMPLSDTMSVSEDTIKQIQQRLLGNMLAPPPQPGQGGPPGPPQRQGGQPGQQPPSPNGSAPSAQPTQGIARPQTNNPGP